jgi:hypothetical protein
MNRNTAIALLALALSTTAARAQIDLAVWGFQPPNTPADLSNSMTSPNVAADSGVFAATSIASGLHLRDQTDWTTPAGNGSSDSFNSNEWTAADYYQFATSTTGFSGLEVLWDQTRSSTGPITFDLLWSTDGSTFSVLLNDYTVLLNDAANGGFWNATTPVPNYTFGPIALPAALDNQANVYFRLEAQVGGTALGGTNRVDNFIVRQIPEPATLSLLALSLLAIRRRR